jgi:hypothetical protein
MPLVNQSFPIRLQLGDGATGLYPIARIRNQSDQIVADVVLTHIANGFYTGQFVASEPGVFSAVYMIYTDAGHTTLSGYTLESEQIEFTAKPFPQVIAEERGRKWPGGF